MEKIIKYFKDKGIEVEEKFLNHLKGGTVVSEKDEYKHDFGTFPPHHNESWYFNFIDRKNNVYLITRWSMEMYDKNSRVMLILIVDGQSYVYFKDIPLETMPDNWEYCKRVKYYCLEPMKKWRITFEDRKLKLDVLYDAIYPVFNFNSDGARDPTELLEDFGLKILDVAAQQHYEQAMNVTGTLIIKKTGEVRRINCHGHRDHSYGTRDWIHIDAWNWAAAYFEDVYLSISRVSVFGKEFYNGFFSTQKGNIPVVKVEVATKTKEDGKTPISSDFKVTDINGKKWNFSTKTIHSLHLPLPSDKGMIEIFEQIAIFSLSEKEGDGISEYLISTRNY
ncbi:MAG: DUF7064 domain-containing protein [Candidatus Helarchaeota archaeon]